MDETEQAEYDPETEAALLNETLEQENTDRLQQLAPEMAAMGIGISQEAINSVRLIVYLERILLSLGILNQSKLSVSERLRDTIDNTEVQVREIKLRAPGVPPGGIDLSHIRGNGANREQRRHPGT